MSSRSFMWFGQKVVRPRGLRKSPGTNAHARCVAGKLRDKKGGGRSGVINRFVAASRECARGQ